MSTEIILFENQFEEMLTFILCAIDDDVLIFRAFFSLSLCTSRSLNNLKLW